MDICTFEIVHKCELFIALFHLKSLTRRMTWFHRHRNVSSASVRLPIGRPPRWWPLPWGQWHYYLCSEIHQYPVFVHARWSYFLPLWSQLVISNFKLQITGFSARIIKNKCSVKLNVCFDIIIHGAVILGPDDNTLTQVRSPSAMTGHANKSL